MNHSGYLLHVRLVLIGLFYIRPTVKMFVCFRVNLKDLNVGVNVKINEEAVAKVLNGKVVALCQRDTDDNKKVFTLGDRPLVCYGQGNYTL